MILYNVTINVEDSACEEWLNWMKQQHIPEVMATGMFRSYKMLKLLSRQEDEEGQTFAIQYSCDSIELYDQYQSEYAPALQADTQKHFGGRFVAFRTLLEEI